MGVLRAGSAVLPVSLESWLCVSVSAALCTQCCGHCHSSITVAGQGQSKTPCWQNPRPPANTVTHLGSSNASRPTLPQVIIEHICLLLMQGPPKVGSTFYTERSKCMRCQVKNGHLKHFHFCPVELDPPDRGKQCAEKGHNMMDRMVSSCSQS